MLTRYRFVLVLCLFIIQLTYTYPAFTQPHIFNKGSRHYLQKIGTEEHARINPIGRQMIIEYATALATNPANLNTYFQCEVSRESTIAASGEVTVRFRVTNGSVSGDASLRGFDIPDVLMPSVFNATLFLSNSKGDTLLYEPQKSLRLALGASSHVRFTVELPPETDTVWVEVKDLFFFHERQDSQRLIARIQKIADYYAADYLLRNVQQQLATVNCRQYDLLPQCFLAMLEVDRILQHIGKANFPEHLSLGVSDPLDMQRRFEIASNTYAYLMREFTGTLRQTDRIYLTQTLETLVTRYIDGITRHINDHPEPGFAAAPFINQLSSIAFAGKEFEQKAGFFRQIAARIRPDLLPNDAVTELLTMTYEAMLLKAKDYIRNVEFNKAVVLLETAGRFCEAFEELECSEDAYFELSKAKHGLFGFYLTVAERAIEMQRPDIASSYVFLGREYQRNNRKLIIHDGEVTVMLIKLFDAWVLEAAKYNRSERYDSAMLLLNRVIQPDIGITPSAAWHSEKAIAMNGLLVSRLSKFGKALITEPLSITEGMYHNLMRYIEQDMLGVELNEQNQLTFNRLRTEFVNQLLDAASADIEGEYFEESMRKLLLVHSMNIHHKTKQTQLADSLSIIAGREVIRQMLRETVSLINQGKTDEGYDLYSHTLTRSEEYGLDKDELTRSRLDEIYDAYLAVKCVQLQSRLDKVLLQAERLVSLQMYSQATDTVDAAYKYATGHQACRFSLDATRAFLDRNQHAAGYQRSLQMADRALSQNDFLASLRHIENAEMLYDKHNLKQFGLKPISLTGYAVSQGNAFLNWFVARRQIQLLKFEQALIVLDLLRESGVSSSEASEIMQELGKLMGIEDRSQVSFFQSFSKPKEYTGGDSWYKPFNRAYRRGLGFSFPGSFGSFRRE
jgi:hypothetical protein